MQLKRDTLLERGKYRILETLGRGGFGITYLAEQVMTRRKVCIKEYFPKDYYNRDADTNRVYIGSQVSPEAMHKYKEKFIKEASVLAHLKHPHIVSVYDVFEENDTAYYVMEYVEGESLNAFVKRCGALDETKAVGYIRQIADALGYIHEQNINHLDVKPGNVMVSSDDDGAILIDFGLAKHYDAVGEQTSSTPVGISHGYAPIEQYTSGGVREFSPSTDIYGLGATLYFLVTGEVPPHATDVGEEGLPKLPDHLSHGVCQAIIGSMQYWRKDRPQGIKEFLKLLDDEQGVVAPVAEATIINVEPKAVDESTVINVKPKQTPQPAPQPKPKKSKRGLWLGIFLFVVAAVASFILFGGGSSKQNTPKVDASMVDTLNRGVNSDTLNLVEPTVDTQNVDVKVERIQQNNEIWYTSTDGSVVDPNNKNVFGAKIVSNTYEGDFGIVTFDGDVTKVGAQAFYNCKKLKSVTLPNSVTEIGSMAFNSCGALSNIYIPDSVTKIGENAFAYSAITSITIPNSMTKINPKSLSHTSLTSVTIPDSVTEIGFQAFFRCDSLTSVTIPNSVTTIGEYAFYNCDSLTSVTIPDSVTTIGEYAFYQCDSLTSVTIPDSVTTIGEHAFSYCESLKSVTIPNSVTTIGEDAFLSCKSLTSVTIPNSVKTIGKGAFESCSSLTSVTIPNSVTTIGEWAFAGCDSLKSVTIPNSVKTIGEGAFYSCDSLKSVTIPNSVKTIGDHAFRQCSSLTSITIPNSVTTIGNNAFHECDNLSKESKNNIKSINPNAL